MDPVILSALHEDIGDGDHSTLACISPDNRGKARMIAKADGIICGIPVGKRVFELVDPTLVVTTYKTDGDAVAKGDLILTVEGPSGSILTAERTALNFMQRMSGIATQTHAMTDMLKGVNQDELNALAAARPRPTCVSSRNMLLKPAVARTTVSDFTT